ncbi:MAG: TRAP transporter small permease [Rubrivivax sp.]|nr:TRAP transporter small permease [Rubrivivax sp.]
MREILLRTERVTTGLATALACLMMAVAASLGLWQIVTRFVIERPAEWTEVLIRFSLIWMVFLGIPLAFRIGAMVSVDVLYRWAGPRMKRVLDTLVALAALLLLAVIVIVGWDYALRGRVQTVIGLEDVSMFWAYLALPVGGVFAAVAVVGNWLDPQRLELENAQ